jgi:hypothetical protein
VAKFNALNSKLYSSSTPFSGEHGHEPLLVILIKLFNPLVHPIVFVAFESSCCLAPFFPFLVCKKLKFFGHLVVLLPFVLSCVQEAKVVKLKELKALFFIDVFFKLALTQVFLVILFCFFFFSSWPSCSPFFVSCMQEARIVKCSGLSNVLVLCARVEIEKT